MNSVFKTYFQKSSTDNALFVILNFASSIIIFGRSVLFLKFLENIDLGIVLIIQTIISFIGLAQIGLYNGGTRLFSLDSEISNHKRINDVNSTYTLIASSILFVAALFIRRYVELNTYILLMTIVAGGATMLKTWYTNILIARRKVKEVNILTIISTTISSLIALSVIKVGIFGAILTIFSLPITFVLFFFIRNREYIPKHLHIDLKLIRRELTFGFIPYLGGLVVLLNTQLDRFFIAGILDVESLGELYLASIFIRFFNLFPASLNSLYMPKAINEYSNRNILNENILVKKYFLALLAYSVLAVIGIVVFAKPAILSIFPAKVSQLPFLYLIMPGIIIQTLSKPLNLILHASLNLNAILYSSIIALIMYILILLGLEQFESFTLTSVSISKSIQGVVLAVATILFFMASRQKVRSYHYINLKKYE